MKNFLSLTRLYMKRALRLFVFVLLIALLCFGACALFFTAARSNGEDRANEKLRIGITGEENSPYMALAELVLKNDPLTASAEILRVDGGEARDLVRRGELSACIVFPEGFFDAIGVGEHKLIRFITPSDGTGIGQLMLRDVVSASSEILLACENSIYGVQRFIAEKGLSADPVNESNELIKSYFLRFHEREDLVRSERVETYAPSRDGAFRTASLMSFFMMIVGASAAPLYLADRRPMKKMTAFFGVSSFSDTLARFTVHLCLCLLCTFAGVLFVFLYAGGTGFPVSSFFGERPAAAILRVLFCAACFSSVSYFFFAVSKNAPEAVLLHVLFGLVAGYLSGCFYPVSYFSEGIRDVLSTIPAARAIALIDSFDLPGFAELLLMGVLFFVLSVFFDAREAGGKRRAV